MFSGHVCILIWDSANQIIKVYEFSQNSYLKSHRNFKLLHSILSFKKFIISNNEKLYDFSIQ